MRLIAPGSGSGPGSGGLSRPARWKRLRGVDEARRTAQLFSSLTSPTDTRGRGVYSRMLHGGLGPSVVVVQVVLSMEPVRDCCYSGTAHRLCGSAGVSAYSGDDLRIPDGRGKAW